MSMSVRVLDNNPILAFEEWFIRRRMRPTDLPFGLFWGMAIIGIGFSILVLAITYLEPDSLMRPWPQPTWDDWRFYAGRIAVVSLLTVHFLVLIRTAGTASLSILAHDTMAWEHLALTGISARRVIAGKWWAVVKVRWRAFLQLAFLRGVYTLPLSYFLLGQGMFFRASTELPDNILTRYALAVLVMMALTMLNLFYTSAAVVLAAVWSSGKTPVMLRAMAYRTFGLIGVAVVAALTELIVFSTRPTVYYAGNRNITITTPADNALREFFKSWTYGALDNGSYGAIHMASPLHSADHMLFYGLLLIMVTLPVLTVFFLWFSTWSAKRRGLLPT